jgi:hypothetical protein
VRATAGPAIVQREVRRRVMAVLADGECDSGLDAGREEEESPNARRPLCCWAVPGRWQRRWRGRRRGGGGAAARNGLDAQ